MKYVLQGIYECSGFSSCGAILCLYDERRTRCKSCDTCHDIPIWLKNEVSSHSNIGHCLYLKLSLTSFKNKFQQKQLALYKSYASAQSGNPDQP